MHRSILHKGAAAGLLLLGLGVADAGAFVGQPGSGSGLPTLGATPVAMCGYTCRSGGRYVPGPPEVCYERGMEYCGSSRAPSVGIEAPGIRFGINGDRDRYRGDRDEYRGGCRTVTIERDDGSVRRIRRCD